MMDATFDEDCLVFIIDTDHYAGNFEREMIAYCTGLVGECGVGEVQSNIFDNEMSEKYIALMEENLISFPDEHGCYRPATIWQNESTGEYESVACFIEQGVDAPTSEDLQEIINVIKHRSQEFAEKKAIKILGHRLLKRGVSYSEVLE